MEKYEARVEKCVLGNSKSPSKNPPKTHLYSFVSAFREFPPVTGISYLSDADLGILLVEAGDLESVYPCPGQQDGEISASALETWEGYVSDPSRGLAERIFGRPSRVPVEEGLWWGYLLNTAPPTTVLMKEGHIGFAAKNQNRGGVRG